MAFTLAFVAEEPCTRDWFFDPASNNDDLLCGFQALRRLMEARGDRVHTLDVVRERGETPDALIFLDVPRHGYEAMVPASLHGVPRLLLLNECEAVLPHNWEPGAHDPFEVVFTWRDPLVDGRRYIKRNSANRCDAPVPVDLDAVDRNLVTMIAGNKSSPHPLELYSHRVRAIRWFERHHIDEFSLYGMGWGNPGAIYPSWSGAPERKRPVLERFWFSICYENAQQIPGYITEKLFDCLKAGNVPVYWGAGNIADHVPPECYIDARRFGSYEELYERLTAIDADEYRAFLDAAAAFLAGPARAAFSEEAWALGVMEQLGLAGGATLERPVVRGGADVGHRLAG